MPERGKINIGHRQAEQPSLFQLNNDRNRLIHRQMWFGPIASTFDTETGTGVIVWETGKGFYIEEWERGREKAFWLLTPPWIDKLIEEFGPDHK